MSVIEHDSIDSDRQGNGSMGRMGKALLAAVLCIAGSGAARAIDILPGDYAALPDGTTIGLLYGQYGRYDRLKVDGVGKVPDSHMDAALGIARIVHYESIGALPVSVQAILPFGGFPSAQVGGADRATRNGIGDLTLAVGAYPIHDPDPEYGLTLGVATFVTLPTGAYGAGRVSIGSGTYTVTPQIGIIKGLGGGFIIDVAADAAFAMDHTEEGIRYRVDPKYQVQSYLRYMLTPSSAVAVGYSGNFGGRQIVGGSYSGLKSDSHQLRLTASSFITPTVQLQGMVGSDVSSDAGFHQAVVGQARLLFVF